MSDAVEVVERVETVSANVAVVQSVYDAFARQDVAKLLELFDADGTIYQSSRLPWGGDYLGHQGLGEFLGKLTGQIASAVTTERYIDDEAGHVVAVGTTRGTVHATGVPFEIAEVHLWTIANGKVTRFDSYIDTPKMRAALGL